MSGETSPAPLTKRQRVAQVILFAGTLTFIASQLFPEEARGGDNWVRYDDHIGWIFRPYFDFIGVLLYARVDVAALMEVMMLTPIVAVWIIAPWVVRYLSLARPFSLLLGVVMLGGAVWRCCQVVGSIKRASFLHLSWVEILSFLYSWGFWLMLLATLISGIGLLLVPRTRSSHKA
jgi:hypothetical protein